MSRQKDKEERVKQQQVAVVIGSSSGIGYETSLMLARNGFYVFVTVRKLEEDLNHITDRAVKENLPLQVIQLDVNNDKSVIDAIDTIAKEKHRIDVLVNNAGYDLAGGIEEASMDEIRAQSKSQNKYRLVGRNTFLLV
jgi:NADP-dependent 3-hydroxy acid dehydrogenase YdfG